VEIYRRGTREQDRREFSFRCRAFIDAEVLPQYSSPVSERDHLSIISTTRFAIENFGNGILSHDEYRYASAQKLVNLYLKYAWCLGRIAEPPHCPVDRIVIQQTRLRDTVSWTKIRREDEYVAVIDAIREEANRVGMSIAVWELSVYGT
jgi:hypothetical protein